MRFLIFLISLLASALPISGHAARPMITDDARIVDPKSCQVESWAKFNKDSTEFWALPGCNIGNNLEITYGGARTKESGESHTTDTILQAKTLFKKLTTNGYGIGLAIGNAQRPRNANSDNLIGDAYFYVPVSFSMLDDKFVLHTNLGAVHRREEHVTRTTWGIGSETQISNNTYFIAEVYGETGSRPFHQLGIRHWIVRNHVQVDTTYGNQFSYDTEERWFTIGLRLLSNPFLPW